MEKKTKLKLKFHVCSHTEEFSEFQLIFSPTEVFSYPQTEEFSGSPTEMFSCSPTDVFSCFQAVLFSAPTKMFNGSPI